MSFAGARVLAFESRRANEMAELIRMNEGNPQIAPALIEVPLEHNEHAFQFLDDLRSCKFDMVIFLTGVGARQLANVLSTRAEQSVFLDALRKMAVVARGSKPSSVLREWNVPVSVLVPEPNTWREVLSSVAARPETRVAIQEYGRPNPDLIKGLEEQGRTVTSVPVYAWQLPPDTEPLRQAIDKLVNAQVDAALFTTGVQIDHLMEFAASIDRRESVLKALHRITIYSVGPDCSEALRSHGLEPAMEPSRPKMGILVREAAEHYAANR